ncbi:amidohydrolase family protein [Maribacter halichondriae]|uniref:amidohydrolase family protein n=1 Tax=Maribacter halichondriae TaxID=2980554 RepID=UPI0023596483|nr:amidohydrolase family protein [Maribacter sp. Hal144]
MKNNIHPLPYLLFFTLFFLACTAEKKNTYDIAILNGSTIDLETGAIALNDIFISDGRIQKVTSSETHENFEAGQTIDATGKYMLPGFWDNHVHFRGGDSLIEANKNFLKLFIANGITTVRDAGGDLTPSVMQWKKEYANEDLVGPTIFTSGPKIDGPGATWAGSLEVEKDDDIFNALDSLQKIPVDFVKLYDSRISGDMYLKTISEAENRNMITSGHMPFTVTLDETIGAGIDAIEHLYYIMKGCSSKEYEITQRLQNKEIGFWDAMPLLMESFSDSTAQNTFRTLKENNVHVVPTLHIGKTLSYLDEVDHSKDDYLIYMTPGIIETYQGRINRAKNASEKAVADRKALGTFFGKLSKSLNDAGVGLLAGSDSGAYNSFTYPGISLHEELEEMVANGISPLDALRTSAYNGSKFLKKNLDYGSITEGKVSDLVILDANPLEDISNTKTLNKVIKGNVIFDKKQLQELLDSTVAK